jgi:hypothetical protein
LLNRIELTEDVKTEEYIKDWLSKKTGRLTDSQNDLANKLYSELSKRLDEREKLEEIEAPLYEIPKKASKPYKIKDVYEGKPVMQVKSYKKDHRTIRGYAKTYNKWTPAQTKFLVSRKQNKIPVKEVVTKYNTHFKENPRPEKSIKSKFYRVK